MGQSLKEVQVTNEHLDSLNFLERDIFEKMKENRK